MKELLDLVVGVTITNCFYVVRNMNRYAILVHGFLSRSGYVLDYKSNTLNIHKKKIPLQQNAHISSILRFQHSSLLSPHFVNLIPLKLKAHISPLKVLILSRV